MTGTGTRPEPEDRTAIAAGSTRAGTCAVLVDEGQRTAVPGVDRGPPRTRPRPGP